ncbi:MAG: class I SAM-dependent methyltransferase [Thermodesulfobacteriota bacterium]
MERAGVMGGSTRDSMKEHLEILRCPVTGSRLREADESWLDDLNEKIVRGELFHLTGAPAKEPLKAALVTVGGGGGGKEYAYRIEDAILFLLKDTALVMDSSTPLAAGAGGAGGAGAGEATEKKRVKDFYDQVGWTKSSDETFVDASKFEDLRPVSKDYIHKCHMRVKRHIRGGGKYLLDVASGPVQYPEYLTYSSGFEYRICMDISIGALVHAREKLGDSGLYILGDITNLPIADDSLDAVVSLHTIYHVPEDEQSTAFFELERVLAPGASGAVVYSWGGDALLMKLAFFPAWLVMSIVRAIRGGGREEVEGEGLYFHAHTYGWFKRKVAERIDADILTWRSVSIPFMRVYVHRWLLGSGLLSLIYAVEELSPRFFGRYGAYPMIVIRKRSRT